MCATVDSQCLEYLGYNFDQFIRMVQRCSNAGLMEIADMVINHMTGHGSSGQGTGINFTIKKRMQIIILEDK